MKYTTRLDAKLGLFDKDGNFKYPSAFVFMELARERFVADLMKECKNIPKDSIHMVVLSASATFRKSGSINDIPVVKLWPTSIGLSSWALHYEIWDEQTNELKVVGDSIQVCVDKATGSKREINAEFRALLEKRLDRGILSQA